MAIDFPSSPAVNQQFASGGTTWIWNGTSWDLYLGGDIVTQSSLSSTLTSYALISSLAQYQKLIPYQFLPPSDPLDGDYYVNNSENILYVYSQELLDWVALGGSGGGGDSDQTIIASRMFS